MAQKNTRASDLAAVAIIVSYKLVGLLVWWWLENQL